MLGIRFLLACILTLGASLPATEDPNSTEGDEPASQATAAERAKALRDMDAECSKLIQQLQDEETPTPENHVRLKQLVAELKRLREAEPHEQGFWKPALEDVDAKDPSDLYFQGWLLCREAEQLRKKGRPFLALEKLLRAGQLFEEIASRFPEWKTTMVNGRRESTKELTTVIVTEAQEAD